MTVAVAGEPHCDRTPQARTIVASDGYVLTADRYRTNAPLRGYLVIAGAIGVPQQFYRRFAEYARTRGYETFTFDYRGIGRSAPRSLRGFEMEFCDWGRRDLAAVIDTVADEADRYGVPVHVVAHSFGGHAFGMTPNHTRVAACFSYGTGAGWHGWMPPVERIKVLALWNVIGPVLTWWKRYLPWSVLGMGEDLPLAVYRQWRQWCRNPHFFFDDPHIGLQMRAAFARVRTPMLATASVDDAWSPPRSRDAILSGYRNASVNTINYDPRELGIGNLGHMGFFRSSGTSLWPAAIDWIESATDECSAKVQDGE